MAKFKRASINPTILGLKKKKTWIITYSPPKKSRSTETLNQEFTVRKNSLPEQEEILLLH